MDVDNIIPLPFEASSRRIATGMCRLPADSCTAIQGSCTTVGTECPSGYGGYFALDCPQGQNGQCCIPLN